jgi:3-vinyl bacteriochlorophyllide hydratase
MLFVQSLEAVRKRREASVWTKIHPIFAIGQLAVFLVSVTLLILYFFHIVSFETVHVSVLTKIALMIGAVVTGSLWEHDVYGKWWFAYEFLIEDVMTANVFLLHIGYLLVYYFWPENTRAVFAMLFVAYAVYATNVAQYIHSHVNAQREKAEADKKKQEIAA